MRKTFLLLAIFMLAMPVAAFTADESMINPLPSWRRGGQGRIYAPGVRIALPDGRRAIIERILPNGLLQTDLGVAINPDGTLPDAPGIRAEVLEVPDVATTPVEPDAVGVVESPDIVESPETPIPASPEINKAEIPLVAAPDTTQPDSEKPLSLAEMIPLTQNPPKKTPPAATPAKPETPAKKPQAKPERHDQPKPEAKAEKKEPPKREKPARKAKSGEELRIPEDAIKTGNLDFLEGCWQGTRPEYYSKRTIKECFCFGANGKNGKRRVIDPQGGRSCIGATSARLSGNGVLSVTSKGAACDDGERWGQAEMECRNSGQKTPCSWVFRDANNGRQSYTIPFVKVDSCGR